MAENQPRVVQLVLLPPELLHHTLLYLDYAELSRARLTCKLLYSVTMSRQFWHDHLERLYRHCGYVPLEERLEDYTINELASLVLRRLRAHQYWSADNSSLNFHSRSFDPWRVFLYRLLPGGRWMLAMNHEGECREYDLDRPNIKGRVLFDSSSIRNESSITSGLNRFSRFAIWMDNKSKRLSFRTASWNPMLGSLFNGHVTMTVIHQIDLIGHGPEATLVAKPVANLCDERNLMAVSAAISEHYLVQINCEHLSRVAEICLISYNSSACTAQVDNRVQISYPELINQLQFANKDQLITISDYCIEIFTIPQIFAHHSDETLQPLQRFSMNFAFDVMSEIFPCQQSACILGSFMNEVNLITITNDTEIPLTSLSFFEQPFDRRNDKLIPAIGPSATILPQAEGYLDIITYSLSDPSAHALCKRSQPLMIDGSRARLEGYEIHGMDETVGRILLVRHRDGHCVVLDTTSY